MCEGGIEKYIQQGREWSLRVFPIVLSLTLSSVTGFLIMSAVTGFLNISSVTGFLRIVSPVSGQLSTDILTLNKTQMSAAGPLGPLVLLCNTLCSSFVIISLRNALL